MSIGRWRFLLLMLAILTASLPITGTAALAQSLQPNASWTNQNGSRLTIQAIAPNGSFTGSYLSRSGGCRDQSYPVTGWIDGQKVSFSLRWANLATDCQGITSWTGYLGPRGLLTHWTFVHFNHRGTPVLTSGTDTFR